MKTKVTKTNVTKKKAPVPNTGGAGFVFEDHIASRFLLDLLGQTNTFGVETFGKVVRVDWQARESGWLADDLVITSELGANHRCAGVSAKSGQSVTTRGFPTDFVQTCWAQWFQNGSKRAFRDSPDVLVLATGDGCEDAEKPWSTLLMQSLATGPERMVQRLIDDKAEGQQTSQEQRAIFNSFACPEPFVAKHSGPEETVRLIQQVRWRNFDFEKPDSRDFGMALEDCKSVLVPNEAHLAPTLWGRLIAIAATKRKLGGTLKLGDLLKELNGQFNFKDNPDFVGDWAALDSRSTPEMAAIKTQIANLPQLTRASDLDEIHKELRSRSACFLIGDSGCGKSALAKEFATRYFRHVIWFNSDSLEYASLPDFEKGIGLRHGLVEIVDATVESTILIFDALEGYSSKARKVAHQIISAVRVSASAERTKIILIAQAESAPSLIANLIAIGVSNDLLQTTFVKRPPENDVRTMVAGVPGIGWVALNPEIKTLLTNLKILDWFVQFSRSGGTINKSSIGLTNLIDSLWANWVETGGERFAKAALLIKIATIEADNHINGVARSNLEPAELSTLGKVADGELLRVENNRIRFAHDLISDWARLHALIDGDWLATPQSRERYASPRWFRAIRLYGQRLLEQSSDGYESWHNALKAVDDATPTGTLIRDLFIEALFLAPNSVGLLEMAWPVLITDNGKILRILIDRFLIVATLPDPRLAVLLDQGKDISKYEHLMRLPFWPYWGPLIAVLQAHSQDVIQLACYGAAKVCAMWLSTTNYDNFKMVWREEAAGLAVAIAREVQFQNAQGPHYSAGADKPVFEALLLAAAELPEEAGRLCLELAKRRDLDRDIAKRVAEARAKQAEERRKQEATAAPKRRSMPEPISIIGRLRKPWPDGPKSRIDGDFEKACLDGAAFSSLAKANPDVALEVLLAVCIEEPQHEEYGQSYREQLGLSYWQSGEPPIWFRGPFLPFLNASPEQALTFIIKLTNFATKRCSPRQHLAFKIGGKEKRWFGNSNAFTWHYDGHTFGGAILHCALMALEKWLYDQLDAKKDITPTLDRIMNESESVAFAGLLLTVGKKEPALFMGVLAPLVQEWFLWSWDIQLTAHRQSGAGGGFGYWGSQPQVAIKIAQEWIRLPHRSKSMRDLMVTQFLPNMEHDKFFKKLIHFWEGYLDKDREPVDLRQLIEVIRKENYKFGVSEGKPETIEFTLPESDSIEYAAKSDRATETLQFLRLPMQCRKILDAGTPIKPEPLYEFLKSSSGKVVEKDESGDEPVHPVEDTIFGGIAVLLVLHHEWLTADRSRLEWCRGQLEASLILTPPRSRYYSELTPGNETSDAFIAEAGIAMLARDPTDQLARTLSARGVLSFFYSTTQLVMRKAFAVRAQLHGDFKRMVAIALRWSTIRTPLRILQSNFPAQLAEWENRKRELEQSFVNGTISTTLPSIDALNNEARMAIDEAELIRNPEHVAFLKAKAHRKGIRTHREEIYPKRLGLDPRIVSAALVWLDVNHVEGSTTRAEIISWLWQLRDLVLNAVPVIENREEEELRGHPSEFDSWVFGLLCHAIPLLAASEKPEQLWQPILDLGPHPHDWIERFYWDWFTRGSQAKSDPADFFRHWRAMIEYALNNPKWDHKTNWHHQTDGMVFELLGFNSNWSAWKTIPGAVGHLDAMADLYERAATKWFHLPKVLAGFAHFAQSLPTSGLALKSISWIATAIKDYDTYDWRYGTEEAMIDFVDTCWQRHAKVITNNGSLRMAFFDILRALVARGSHAAITLRDRIANETQG